MSKWRLIYNTIGPDDTYICFFCLWHICLTVNTLWYNLFPVRKLYETKQAANWSCWRKAMTNHSTKYCRSDFCKQCSLTVSYGIVLSIACHLFQVLPQFIIHFVFNLSAFSQRHIIQYLSNFQDRSLLFDMCMLIFESRGRLRFRLRLS